MLAKQGSPVRHAYMNQLVKLECSQRGVHPFKMLEIGSWAGGSAITWAQAIKDYYRGNGVVVCVDSWEPYHDLKRDQSLHYQRMNEALAAGKIFRLFMHNIKTLGHNDIVYPVKAPADRILPFFATTQFDLVFVDGDHAYSNVLRDLKHCTRLVAEGGILCGDDLELQLSQVDMENARTTSEMDFVLDSKTGLWFHPGVTVAVNQMFGDVSVWEGFWAVRRHGDGWEKVVMEDGILHDLVIPSHLASFS